MTETLLEFPAEIKIKAMGLNSADFESCVSELVVPLIETDQYSVTTLPSKAGKYLSVRVQFVVQNQAELERVYAALHNEPRVLYTL